MEAEPDMEPAAAINARLDAFIDMIRNRDLALLDELWGDGRFRMIGSEVGEICRTRAELQAKIGSICASPAQFVFAFPVREITILDCVAWIFAEGTLTRIESGSAASRPYLANVIFERTEDGWQWRQFFGSEPD